MSKKTNSFLSIINSDTSYTQIDSSQNTLCLDRGNEESFFRYKVLPETFQDVDLNHWKGIIRSTVKQRHFIWPSDMILHNDKRALIFPSRRNEQNCIPANISELENDDVYRFCYDFLRIWDDFYNEGYAYHELKDRCIKAFKNKNGEYDIWMDFSLSLNKCSMPEQVNNVLKDRVCREYLDSVSFRNGVDGTHYELSVKSDYYAISVLLFKLLFKVLPFDGELLATVPRFTPLQEEFWQISYHSENKRFIFDFDEGNQNRLSETFEINRRKLLRWKNAPDNLKKMFENTFITDISQHRIYSPGDWKLAFEKIIKLRKAW